MLPPKLTDDELLARAGRGYNAYYQFLEQNNLLPPYALPWERVPEIWKKAWMAAAKGVLESGADAERDRGAYAPPARART